MGVGSVAIIMSERNEASGTCGSLGVDVSFRKTPGGCQHPGLCPRRFNNGGCWLLDGGNSEKHSQENGRLGISFSGSFSRIFILLYFYFLKILFIYF